MWKYAGKRVVTAIVGEKLQWSRIEVNGHSVRLVKEE